MNETQKTGVFALIAALAVVLAIWTRPVSITKEDEKSGLSAGDLLFKEDASDATKAGKLKITKFDENKLSMKSFEIIRDKANGLWKIPSEYDYPADADEQLKNVTSPLADLKILSIIEDAGRDDHTLYGVVEPNEKLEAGVTGVGMMVSLADSNGKSMAGLIIGKQVDKAQPNIRYVRMPNQDPVYTVEIDTAAFDTDFKKWIKPDLLKVSSMDITGVGIRDYQTQQQASQQGIRVNMLRTMEADASFDAANNKWKLDRLIGYEGTTAKEEQLAETDELKSDKLNSLRTAAQNLQIVGVRPKPKGLAADLKADKSLLENEESMVSLLEQGFVPHAVGSSTEILATAGETLLTTRDAVQYTLRFGEEAVKSALETEAATGEEKTDSPTTKRERFLLVTAAVDESKFPVPDLQPVPATIEDLKKLDAEKAAAEAAKKAAEEAVAKPTELNLGQPATPPAESATPAQPTAEGDAKAPAKTDAKIDEAKPEEPKQPDATSDAKPEAKPEENKPEEPKADSNTKPEQALLRTSANVKFTSALVQDGAKAEASTEGSPQATTAAPALTGETKPAEVQSADGKSADGKPADGKPAEGKPDSKPLEQMSEEELKDRLSVVQADITKANQRLIDAREDKLKAARKKAQELNARFADWYYLIDDASFKQLMLKRDVLIGPKSAPSGPAASGIPGVPNIPGLDPGSSLPGIPNLGNQQ